MSTRFSIIVWIVILIFSCNKQRDANATDEISGAYAREYSFKVINQETGKEIGTRTVRDSIFICTVGARFQVSNKKWRLNDYDKEGWQNLQHGDDPPIRAFTSTLNINSWTLTSKDEIVLHYNRKKSEVFWHQAKPYRKVTKARLNHTGH